MYINDGCKCWSNAFCGFDGLQELDVPAVFDKDLEPQGPIWNRCNLLRKMIYLKRF